MYKLTESETDTDTATDTDTDMKAEREKEERLCVYEHVKRYAVHVTLSAMTATYI